MKAKILKNTLRRLRYNRRELTQEQLAQAVGVSRQTILAIESGKFNPSVRLALLIAKYFGQTVEEIFSLEDKDDSKS